MSLALIRAQLKESGRQNILALTASLGVLTWRPGRTSAPGLAMLELTAEEAFAASAMSVHKIRNCEQSAQPNHARKFRIF
jgi:hypothetical protein